MNESTVARKLNEAMNLTGAAALTAQDVTDWFEGGDNFDKTEAVVRAYMSDEMFDAIEPTARLTSVLEARLKSYDTATIGGMKFRNLQQGLRKA